MKDHVTFQQAISEGRLGEFIAQAEARGVGPFREAEFDEAASQVFKHQVRLAAMGLTYSEFIQVRAHVFLTDLDVGATDRVFEVTPEAFNVVYMVQLVGVCIIYCPLFCPMLNGNLRVAVLFEPMTMVLPAAPRPRFPGRLPPT